MKHLPKFHLLFSFSLLLLICMTPGHSVQAQDYVTGSFEGEVKDSTTGLPIVGAIVRITNQETGVPGAKLTDSAGRFRQGLLPPGDYTITVEKAGYISLNLQRSLPALRPTVVLPPVPLVREGTAAATAVPTPNAAAAATPAPGTSNQPATKDPTTSVASAPNQPSIREEINSIDARRGGTFTEQQVSSLPLGGSTLTRTFDELALLLPGITSPPQTQGSVAGPGVGSGVGSAGQFSANGLRSRSNNFTVDGSDNNDEDIGVRRQGFLALVPQPIESIKEFQVISLLAPAQFGRNMGAQVNAISKSGGNETHGTLFGLLNTSQLNARNFFDTTNGNSTSPVRSGNQNVIIGSAVTFNPGTFSFIPTNPRPFTVTNQSSAKDSFTLGQGGLVLGGPLVPDKMFYFFSMEGQLLNATKEASFAVPTVAQRGLFGTGASGIFVTPFLDVSPDCLVDGFCAPVGSPNAFFPTSFGADATFSLFPFPNNPGGVYGANTFTQVLPAGGQGKVISGKVDGNWKISNRQQSFTSRYNFTDDWRDIPVTGEAIFSTLRPRIRTQNFSNFLNSELSDPNSTRPLFNQLRLSYGRTRLVFGDHPDQTFQLPSGRFPTTPFLLNAPLIENFTLPAGFGTRNTGNVVFRALPGATVEQVLGPIGQVSIAGFSPLGVDVFNFPQRRVNNTYQLADTVSWHLGRHSLAFGTDIRRTELNSELPRNSRPLITFNGAPRLTFNAGKFAFDNTFIPAIDLAAASAASGFFQTLSTTDSSTIHLRYYQYDFFGQDEWRIRPNLSLSLGLRYEYNTPPSESNDLIERTFTDPSLGLVPGLQKFVDGRTQIFDPNKNNFAPRLGIAYSPSLFGPDHTTVIRAGYGMFYDQILGAVVSQSRNVFPTTVTVNLAGGTANLGIDLPFPFGQFGILNPVQPALGLVQPGTLNRLNPAFTLAQQVSFLNFIASGGGNLSPAGGVGITLPARRLETPWAHQYSLTVEQQLNTKLVASAGYVGTMGRNLLRATSPNLGPNAILIPLGIDASDISPVFSGVALQPGSRISPTGFITGGRPTNTVGAVTFYDTTSTSRYDALQLQLRGRYNFLGSTQFQVNYTFGKVTDDASDVFDLAGSSALPQNSLTFAGERGPANFDVRHRYSSDYVSDFSSWGKKNALLHVLFDGTQLAGTGVFQTGQPFTVNSIFDVNLDGNLTDRLNSTNGIVLTGDRSQPLRLTVNPTTLLAPVGQDGGVGRNTFRASNLWLTNVAVIKTIHFGEQAKLIFRTEFFNFFNRANFAVPVRFIESPGFGKSTETVTPGRRIQFGLKLAF